MIKFFLKKNFCDGWDNLLQLFIYNVAFVLWGAFLGVSWFTTSEYVASYHPVLLIISAFVAVSLFMIPVFAWGVNARKIADFNTPSVGVFFRAMKVVWKIAVGFSLLVTVVVYASINAIPYYWTQYGVVGVLISAAIFWFLFVSLMAIQYFLPLYFLQEQNGFRKCLKKSFIIFFDNPFFSFFLLLYNLVLLGLSVAFYFIAPGINGITLSNMNALRLRLYKYDWLEEHPDYVNDRDKRSEVPWDELLKEDVELLGPRKLASFIFPWR